MSISYKRGDLFSTDISTLVHGCNAQGVMGSGVAKVIREHYPEAYERYRQAYEAATDKHLSQLPLGEIIAVQTKGKLIINAITQRYYGRDGMRYCSYDAIDEAMKRINALCVFNNITDIAMPQIGAGLGGGHWPTIAQIIEHRLTSVKPTVYQL